MMTTAEQIATGVSAKTALRMATEEVKNKGLCAMAVALRQDMADILEANTRDEEKLLGTVPQAMLDRIHLNPERVEAMAKSLEELAELPDPVGRILSSHTPPNGIHIQKIACPMGLIAIIYESRPNVTSDAVGLALKAGSACVLRVGKEAHGSAAAIVNALHKGLAQVGLPQEAIVLVADTSRDSALELMTAKGQVDLLIPRGGKGLISACVEQATVPVVETGTGICHAYVDAEVDLELAVKVVANGKTSRPTVCNALEVCLVHRQVADKFLPLLWEKFDQLGVPPVEIRFAQGDEAYFSGESVSVAGEQDFDTEFLDYVLAVAVVDSLEEAIEHISAHSTGHSEVILTQNQDNARKFTQMVDSAVVYVNASTRFTDGGEFGMGCEMGISTQKLHARGPMGLEELCSYKYVVTGEGQIR